MRDAYEKCDGSQPMTRQRKTNLLSSGGSGKAASASAPAAKRSRLGANQGAASFRAPDTNSMLNSYADVYSGDSGSNVFKFGR